MTDGVREQTVAFGVVTPTRTFAGSDVDQEDTTSTIAASLSKFKI